LEFLLEDRGQHVDADRDPALGLHRVLGGPVEGLDASVRLDPLEEELDLPPTLVPWGDLQRGQREVVGQEHEPLPRLAIAVGDAP
jgi:hypothetical protein